MIKAPYTQIKEVTPMKTLDSPLARFWKEDIKIARDYAVSLDPENSLGEEFIREWVVSMTKWTKLIFR